MHVYPHPGFNRTREPRMNVGSQTRLVIRQDNEGTIHGSSGARARAGEAGGAES